MKYDKIFNRVEEKYLLNKKQKEKLLSMIKEHIKEDKFFKSEMYNIYFDNINNDLIINSIDKPLFKEKVRLRSYGIPKLDDYVFLEIKTKYKGVVGKRRIKVILKEFYEYLNTGKYNNNSQIMKEIDYIFKYYDLKPYIFISYDRLSYRGRDEEDLRITFDSNLRSRLGNLCLEIGNSGSKQYYNDINIMEIKTLNSMPMWLVSALSELKIFPTSFSKVGKIYEKIKKEAQ